LNRSVDRGTAARGRAFRNLRILVLLLVLLFVSARTWEQHYLSTRWVDPLYVAIYPIVADASPVTARYVASLDARRYAPIDRFFAREAARYRVAVATPVETRLRAPPAAHPPERAPGAGVFATAAWSLRLRFWAWRVGLHDKSPEDVQMFVLYRDPALTPTVPHSLGLEKGLIGVVYAFADPRMDGANDVIIAHELMHTLGATDKYDAADDAPRFPDGYGDPRQVPLYPQRTAELMAGRRMIAPDRWVEVGSLDEVVIGPASAREIRWIR
jgi:hypothetical protein